MEAPALSFGGSDGTSPPALFADLNSSTGSNPLFLKAVGSTLYFIADDGTNGIELWKTDGITTPTTRQRY